MMDREIAEQHLDAEAALGDEEIDETATTPRPEGYTLNTYLLMAIIDALQGVQATIIAAAGSDPPTMRPLPRPITAVETLREERRTQSMQALVDLFTGPAAPDTPEVFVEGLDEAETGAGW
ncbi:hypothetical protein ACFXO9_09650 [Nocardia tengchongensis]|uniref:hypothetical protein n=1 Tax=Nocardia tengchongensis TaxID=2055889 RepID=UPI0036BCB9C2